MIGSYTSSILRVDSVQGPVHHIMEMCTTQSSILRGDSVQGPVHHIMEMCTTQSYILRGDSVQGPVHPSWRCVHPSTILRGPLTSAHRTRSVPFLISTPM